jgi:hypothetical protein
MISLAEGCPGLYDLRLSECIAITSYSMIILGEGCTNLHLFNCEGRYQITNICKDTMKVS